MESFNKYLLVRRSAARSERLLCKFDKGNIIRKCKLGLTIPWPKKKKQTKKGGREEGRKKEKETNNLPYSDLRIARREHTLNCI